MLGLLATALSMLALVSGSTSAIAQVDVARFVTIKRGQLPIIISAPHGGRLLLPGIARREDRGQKFFVLTRDERTAELAEALAAGIETRLGGAPFLVIARFDRRHIDANRAAADAYTPPGDGGPRLLYDTYHAALAGAVAEIARVWGRGIVLDIHGQSLRPEAIIRGTENRRTVASLVARSGEAALSGPTSIFGALAARGYAIAPTDAPGDRVERLYRGGHIVQTYGSLHGGAVDAIQVEVGAALRRPDNVAQTAADIAEAVAAFARAYLPRERESSR